MRYNMNKRLLYVWFLLLGATALHAQVQIVVNTNGDFSQSTVGQTNTQISGWTFNGAGTNANFEIVADPENASNNLLKVTLTNVDASGVNAWTVQALQSPSLFAGFTYTASIRVRAENPLAATVQLDGGSGAQLWGQSISGSGWTTLTTAPFIAGANGARNFGIHLSHANNSDNQVIYIDYLRVTHQAASVNVNGDFASSNLGATNADIANWTFNGAGSNATFEVVVDPTNAENKVLKVTLANITGLNAWSVQALQAPTLSGGNKYVAELRVRAENPSNATIQLDGGAGAQLWGQSISGSGWTTLRTPVIVANADGSRNFGIHLSHANNVNGQILYIDYLAIALVEVGSLPPVDPEVEITTPVVVSKWGSINRHGWPIANTSATPAGTGIMQGVGPPESWATLRGDFGGYVTATESEAVVVTGKIEFLGGAPLSWSALRYGLFYHDAPGLYQNGNTPTARWLGAETGYGYLFTPRSGTNDHTGSNRGLGNATTWFVDGSSWISTGGTTVPFALVDQAPRRAEMQPGEYNFAFSVQPRSDGTNEVRWSLVHVNNTYWFAGTAIDTQQVTTKFNAVVFGIINNVTGGITGLKASQVTVTKGAPITIPEAPFSAFWVEDWGAINRAGWPILNNADFLVGDGSMGGTGNPPSGAWATLRGGFGANVRATQDQAVIVTGQLEFVGGGPTSWSALRFGLFNHPSAGTLHDKNTPTARWGTIQYANTDSARFVANETGFGYMFSPRSGTNDHASGNGGNGTAWSVNGTSWISTFGQSLSLGTVEHAPRRAVAAAGLYNFAISVQPQSNGTNEVRFYMIKTDGSYWIGGTFIDQLAVTTQFNGIVFGINNGNDIANTGMTRLNALEVRVNRGAPINIPAPPFSAFYVEDWGLFAGRTGGWTLTPDEVIGNTTISGTAAPDGWANVQGSFGTPVSPTATQNNNQSLVVTGKVTFIGDGFNNGNFRFGLFRNNNIGTRNSQNVWSGGEAASGYLVIPVAGLDPVRPLWPGDQAATFGAVSNTTWFMTNGSGSVPLGFNIQSPSGALGLAGTYDFAISVIPQANGTRRVRYAFYNANYAFGNEVVDTRVNAISSFNSVAFGTNGTARGLKLEDVYVNLTTPHNQPGTVTSIEDEVAALPAVHSLEQNYPNPFNPTTNITFSLPHGSDVRLVVYNVLGQEVLTLANGSFPAGTHSIAFDAHKLASGIYIYRMEAGTFSRTKKMMLVK